MARGLGSDMKKKTLNDGRIVAYIPRNELFASMTWVVAKTEKRIYRCDINGRILSYDGISKRPYELTYEKASDRVRARIKIRGRYNYVDILIARAIFKPYVVETGNVGHFDGDLKNNKVTNIYIDITPMEPTEEIEK